VPSGLSEFVQIWPGRKHSPKAERVCQRVRAGLVGDALVYAGFSAAAVVVYEILKGLELVDDPHDVPFGYDADVVWEGLGLIPFALAVHFKSDDSQSALIDRAIAYYEANGVPNRTLRDGVAAARP